MLRASFFCIVLALSLPFQNSNAIAQNKVVSPSEVIQKLLANIGKADKMDLVDPHLRDGRAWRPEAVTNLQLASVMKVGKLNDSIIGNKAFVKLTCISTPKSLKVLGHDTTVILYAVLRNEDKWRVYDIISPDELALYDGFGPMVDRVIIGRLYKLTSNPIIIRTSNRLDGRTIITKFLADQDGRLIDRTDFDTANNPIFDTHCTYEYTATGEPDGNSFYSAIGESVLEWDCIKDQQGRDSIRRLEGPHHALKEEILFLRDSRGRETRIADHSRTSDIVQTKRYDNHDSILQINVQQKLDGVKSVHGIRYTRDSSGRALKDEELDSMGAVSLKHSYFYPAPDTTIILQFSASDTLQSKTILTFNPLHKLENMRSFFPDGKIWTDLHYEYAENKYLVKVVRNGINQETFTYLNGYVTIHDVAISEF